MVCITKTPFWRNNTNFYPTRNFVRNFNVPNLPRYLGVNIRLFYTGNYYAYGSPMLSLILGFRKHIVLLVHLSEHFLALLARELLRCGKMF